MRRRIVLTASMLGLRGRMQPDRHVIHLVFARLFDLTPMLANVSRRDDEPPQQGETRPASGQGEGALRIKFR